MKIKHNEPELDHVIKVLNTYFKGKGFTINNMYKMSDQIEHFLLHYDKEDIENERFLAPFVIEENCNKTLQLFHQEDIYIEMKFTTIVEMGFQVIDEIKSLHVLKSDSQ